MSTRATYSFIDKRNHKTFVYIHYDGYLEGAAMYFYKTIINPSKGNFATQFIRANPLAEITISHEKHGDTDFKYDITGSGLEAEVNAYQLGERNLSKFSGSMRDFITQYPGMIENFQSFKQIQVRYTTLWLNKTMAKRELADPVSHLSIWRGSYEDGANWQHCMTELRSILEAFPELRTEVPDWLLEKASIH